MAQDSSLLLRSGAANLTASETTASIKIEETGVRGLMAEVNVPSVSGTTPTLDIKIQESNDDSAWNDLVTFSQITATGRYREGFHTEKDYVRATLVTTGTTPNFGLVVVALVDPAGHFKYPGL